MLQIVPMTREYAIEYLNWEYEPPYDFYTIPPEHRAEELDQVLIFCDTHKWFAVLENGRMIGFYEYTVQPDGIEIGLGLAPSFTGKGRGSEFVAQNLAYLQEAFPNLSLPITLRVLDSNARAIHVYEKAGFVETERVSSSCYGTPIQFICMKRSR